MGVLTNMGLICFEIVFLCICNQALWSPFSTVRCNSLNSTKDKGRDEHWTGYRVPILSPWSGLLGAETSLHPKSTSSGSVLGKRFWSEGSGDVMIGDLGDDTESRE